MGFYFGNKNIIGRDAGQDPTNFPVIGMSSGGILFDGVNMLTSGQYTINYTGTMGYFDVTGTVTVTIDAQGGAGGRGMWNANNSPGAPPGRVVSTFTLSTGRYYYWVGEGNKAVNGAGGAGGGSTDIRTVYNGGTTHNITNFLETASLNSRFIVAGGGGGAHGGSYGYYGDPSNSPGRGGPDRSVTNCLANNDSGHVNTGADSTQAGLDGGSSIDSNNYTANGAFGRGGRPSNYFNEGYNATNPGFQRSGWGWPNGGSGTGWASGGGGGGWYGGATNWPNGGGGSNYVQSVTGATLVSTSINAATTATGSGYLIITI